MPGAEKLKTVWTISDLLNWTVNYFKQKKIASARLDAEVLLAKVLKRERIYLYVHFDEPMQENELAKFREYVAKRARHMPVAYIVGEREFMGLPFKVTPDTLIPRPDTEILVESAAKYIDKSKRACIADIGTGSGAIILSLLHNLPNAVGAATDISEKAVAVAKQNAVLLEAEERCSFFVGDLYAPLSGRRFDAIVSNPPYIPQKDIAGLEADVREYEPLSALTDGGDGLKYYRRLLSEGRHYVNGGGFIAVEVGIYQARQVKEIAEANGWIDTEIIKDYAGIDRVVLAWKRS